MRTSVTIVNNGTGWAEGNTAAIAGSSLGGSSNVAFTVETVAGSDTIHIQAGTYEEVFQSEFTSYSFR